MKNRSRRLYAAILVGMAALVVGCGKSTAERVFVDMDRVFAASPAPSLRLEPLPQPPNATPSITVSQPGLPSTSTTDRTLERLEMAKQLIAANRGKSIASLSSMLKQIYLAQAKDKIDRMEHDQQPETDAILDAVLTDLRAMFVRYGEERGPLLAHLGALARSNDLADEQVPDGADAIETSRIEKANKLRAESRKLDAEYDSQAQVLLDAAYAKISDAIGKLEAEASRVRAEAEAKAQAEAESKATKTQTEIDVQLQGLVPDALPTVPARQVNVPGSPALPEAPNDKTDTLFGSLEERRRLLDHEVDIWVKTTGRTRASSKLGARDATEDFLRWRSAHTVGP